VLVIGVLWPVNVLVVGKAHRKKTLDLKMFGYC